MQKFEWNFCSKATTTEHSCIKSFATAVQETNYFFHFVFTISDFFLKKRWYSDEAHFLSPIELLKTTSRDRPRLAPHLRLKHSKRTSKSQKYFLLQYPKNPKVGPNWRAREDALDLSSIPLQIKKMKGALRWQKFEKKSQMPKKLKGVPLGIFQHCVAKLRKIEGKPFGETFFSKKWSHNAEILEGDPLVLVGIVCYAKKGFFVSVR